MTPFGSKSSLLIVRVVQGGSQLGLALDIHLKLEGIQVVEGVGLVASGFSYVMSKSKKINPASQVLAWEALQLAAARAGVSTRKLRAAMGMDHPFRFNPPSSRMNVSVRHELWSSKVS